jgi:hypothetical protein
MKLIYLAVLASLTFGVGCKKDSKTNGVKEPLPTKMTTASTPEEAVSLYYTAINKLDGAAAWDLTCTASQEKMASGPRPPELATSLGISPEELNKMPTREFYVKFVEKGSLSAMYQTMPTGMRVEAKGDTTSLVIFPQGELTCEATTCKDPEGWKFSGDLSCEGGG